MKKQLTKLHLNDMSQQKMYKLFGLRQVASLPVLDNWLSDLPDLDSVETTIATHYQKRLIKNINAWNEQELSLNFIGPIFAAIDFTVPYQINWFAQRPLRQVIDNYELVGKPDGIIASGFMEPEVPFFSFQEFKKELESKGDPIGQNLAAMLIGQTQNDESNPVFGCYVVGRLWFFMALQDKTYAISREFSAASDDIFEIIKVLKALRSILFDRLQLTE
ncbi:MAG: hypothetical protein AAF960_10400 [Bacteroidota bacterium]